MSEHKITVVTTDENMVPQIEISTRTLNRGDKILASYLHRGENPLSRVRLGFPENTICAEVEKDGTTVLSPVTEVTLSPNKTQELRVCAEAPNARFSVQIIGMRSASPTVIVGDGGD